MELCAVFPKQKKRNNLISENKRIDEKTNFDISIEFYVKSKAGTFIHLRHSPTCCHDRV